MRIEDSKGSTAHCLYELYVERQRQEKLKNMPDKKQESHPRVLIIEDQIADVLPMKAVLEDAGCIVELGFDGKGAVEQLVRPDFDLLVVDWLMPDFDGGQALRYAQELIGSKGMGKEKNKNSSIVIPYVAYTGLSVEQLVVPETENFKMVDHWQKPLNVIELAKKVNHYFS